MILCAQPKTGSISMTSLKRFSKKWCHPDHAGQTISEDELSSVEYEFGIYLPLDYREQVLSVGLPSPTLALLSAIDDREVDLHDLSDLCKPSKIREETLEWRKAGLPEDLLVIGSDSMGNKFCYNLSDLQKETGSEASIFFWDHDFLETEKIAPSFTDWINGFLGEWSNGISYSDF